VAVQYLVHSGSVALVAATAKTVVEGVVDASGPPPEWIALNISFDGVTATAVPVLVEFCTYAATGTGTAATPRRLGAAIGVARSTWKTGDTTEPSTAVVFDSLWLPPTGPFLYQWPLGRELLHPTSTVQGIRLTAPAAVNCRLSLTFEE
jgi:hypothetical protein